MEAVQNMVCLLSFSLWDEAGQGGGGGEVPKITQGQPAEELASFHPTQAFLALGIISAKLSGDFSLAGQPQRRKRCTWFALDLSWPSWWPIKWLLAQ